jgi:glyoxylase-like metal-dependent hydrolase (beta-lactamase superfamily II)
MNLIKLVTGKPSENTYLVSENGVDAVIIDPGDDIQAINDALNENNLTCKAMLVTHAHFDHCNACRYFQINGAKVYMHKKDELLVKTVYNLANKFALHFNRFIVDENVKDGDVLSLYGLQFKVLHTPGHTEGSCCYVLNDNIIFSGDTLFNMSIGRTDFPTGNASHMKKSLKKLFSLEKDYTIFPGHGLPTKLLTEKNHNPYA